MKHSKSETFFWLKAAALLDRAEVPDRVTNADPKQLQDFFRVRQSLDQAQTILMCLARREVSIDELDRGTNEVSEMRVGALRVDVKKLALAHIGATGSTAGRIVSYAIKKGVITNEDVIRAKKRKRLPEFDCERIGIFPRFLVEFWCGEAGAAGGVPTRRRRGKLELLQKFSCFEKDGQTVSRNVPGAKRRHYEWPRQKLLMPPLCFFTHKALSEFASIILIEGTNEQAVRKWFSRLRLARPSHPTAPRIRAVKQNPDGLCFYP